MNENEKQEYLDRYKKEKEKGVPFFPDILFKDAIVSLAILIILIALAYFVGAELDAKANPSDNSYTPRPEWYFLFLFQLLKYFPGELEVIGVIVVPSIMLFALFFLPFLDRGPKRHFRNRLAIMGITLFLALGIIGLTVQSAIEIPPPAEVAVGDQTALLYTNNCSTCHGPTISIQPGTDLHEIIAQGSHAGMPAWSGDLSSDQIDALAGFILSPGGSTLFTQACGECHELQELVESNPIELKNTLTQGLTYPAHSELDAETWTGDLDKTQQTQLINFLIAPDGRRLFSIYCASCHGKSIAFSGTQAELEETIKQGGLHLEMPAWQEKLSSADIDLLASYVMDPSANQSAQDLFGQYCSSCHGDQIPDSESIETAKTFIATGGSHQTMPVWGQVLTEEQITALVEYSLTTTEGSGIDAGQELYGQNCSFCHGEFGEGGLNPSNPNDIIFPISTAEYLKTRDDFTLISIISQGQPNSGMSPFGSSYGGPLDDDQINNIVEYMRSWEENPPVELPPNITVETLSFSGAEIYTNICAQCHGPNGEGGVASAFADSSFQETNTDEDISNAINQGHPGTSMIAWAGILSDEQIQSLINFIRSLTPAESETDAQSDEPTSTPTFVDNILPLFEAECTSCHGSLGGWDGTNYEDAINSGNNGPSVIPGDPDGSLLVQKLIGTHKQGNIMPPSGKLPDADIQIVIDWIKAGAPEK